MSWKSTDRTWSITARLVALFTLSASALLLVVVVILYNVIAQHLDEEHERLLSAIVRVLQQATVTRDRSVTELVAQMSRIESDQPESYSDPYTLRVVDAQQRVLAESPGMSAIPIDAFKGVPTRSNGPARVRHWSAPDGNTYLLAAIEAPAAGPKSVVQVALNVTRDRIMMRELRSISILLLAGSLLVAALAGAVVVRHSLRPLDRIASEVAGISAKELERRLDVAARPSELMPLVDAFNRVLDRLDRAFARLSQFSANLAHELRTPLNNLRGEAEVALLSERRPEEYRDVLISSLEEYGRLSKMIDGLLFLARAESQEMKPEWSVVHLADEARAVCEFYAPVAEEKNVMFAVEGDASAEIDSVLVRRALGNVVGNALTHVGPGGRVTIAIAGGKGATVRVVDNGCGIDPEDLPHVVERFYRGAGTRGNGPAGSGLGLAIVKSIMDLHGGSLAIDSAVGRGTTVTLWFPSAAREMNMTQL